MWITQKNGVIFGRNGEIEPKSTVDNLIFGKISLCNLHKLLNSHLDKLTRI